MNVQSLRALSLAGPCVVLAAFSLLAQDPTVAFQPAVDWESSGSQPQRIVAGEFTVFPGLGGGDFGSGVHYGDGTFAWMASAGANSITQAFSTDLEPQAGPGGRPR